MAEPRSTLVLIAPLHDHRDATSGSAVVSGKHVFSMFVAGMAFVLRGGCASILDFRGEWVFTGPVLLGSEVPAEAGHQRRHHLIDSHKALVN